MKILSYNINSCTQTKLDELYKQEADVYIIPEMAKDVKIPDGYFMNWSGKYPSKGLGIIFKNADELKCYNENLTYAIPLCYKDLFILAFWPTKIQKNKKYKDIAKEILDHYIPYFKSKTIITGDFNLFFKNSSHEADITPTKECLIKNGFKSLYHEKYSEEFGSENKATYYHQFKESQPFFLDYTFTNFTVSSFELIDLGRSFSDHVGQIVVI